MKITLLQLDVVLPPPIYKNSLTTLPDKVSRTTGLVKALSKCEGGIIKVESIEGIIYYVSPASIQYWQEE